jgi:hypothetical protein
MLLKATMLHSTALNLTRCVDALCLADRSEWVGMSEANPNVVVQLLLTFHPV